MMKLAGEPNFWTDYDLYARLSPLGELTITVTSQPNGSMRVDVSFTPYSYGLMKPFYHECYSCGSYQSYAPGRYLSDLATYLFLSEYLTPSELCDVTEPGF